MTIALRPATKGDVDLLFAWVNEPDSLANKLQTRHPIDYAAHTAWLDERLSDPGTSIWIIQAGDRPAGQVRFTTRGDTCEIDVYVVGELRNRGIARAALMLAIGEWTSFDGRPHTFIARVKPENLSSRGLFEAAGFSLERTAADHLVYRLSVESH
jgi:RimJ/RimL family protein N-acetyltransferase